MILMLLQPAIMSLIWGLARVKPAVRLLSLVRLRRFRRPHGAGPRFISNGGLEPATIRNAMHLKSFGNEPYRGNSESMHRLEPNMRGIRKIYFDGVSDVLNSTLFVLLYR